MDRPVYPFPEPTVEEKLANVTAEHDRLREAASRLLAALDERPYDLDAYYDVNNAWAPIYQRRTDAREALRKAWRGTSGS